MRDVDTVVFDFDYTLADSSNGVVLCVAHALGEMGLSMPDEATIRQTIGLSLPETYRALTGRDAEEEGAQFHRLFVHKADDVMNAATFLLEGVPAMVRRLEQAGMTLAIVSTKYAYRIQGVLEREGLLDPFAFVIGGNDVAQFKPHPEGLLMAMARLGGPRESMIYVGDSATDAETAQRARARFVGVLSGQTGYDDLAVWPHEALLDDVNQLPDWLGLGGLA